MRQTDLVVTIVEANKKLNKEIAGFILRQGSRACNIIKNLTTFRNLKHDILALPFHSAIIPHVISSTMLNLLHNMRMVQL